MAKNKDTDDEKFEDDEDFGLPELQYEELDDDSDSSEDDSDSKSPEETPEESSSDQAAPASQEEGSFYEEETFDEFKEESDVSTSSSVFDTDESKEEDLFIETDSSSSFGDTATPEPAAPISSYYEDESSVKAKSNFTKIVVIGTLLFVSIAVVFVFMMDGSLPGLSENEEVEPVVEAPVPEPIVEDTAVTEVPVAEELPSAPQENQLTPGEVTTLEQQTGKSYVVIGSFFDGDLAMDYAKVLAKNGESPQIIPPFKDYRFYRVAIAEFNTFKDAEASAPSFAEEFGREAWPLRY